MAYPKTMGRACNLERSRCCVDAPYAAETVRYHRLMKESHDDIAVLGAGASGFAAAICAARGGAHVSLYEAESRVGQSIKVTGDGRCNIANVATTADVYRNEAFVRHAFAACAPEQAIRFLESCGLLLREEAEGRLYPQANKSTSVIDALRLTARHVGVHEITGKRAQALSERDGRWSVSFADTSRVESDAVVVCCGHHLTSGLMPDDVALIPLRPVLGPLACDTTPIRGLDKVRAKCALTLESGAGRPVRENGEVTFRSFGMSGIAAFNMSRIARKGDTVMVDFLPGFTPDESLPYLRRRMDRLSADTWYDLLCGMVLPLVARSVLRAAYLDPDAKPDQAGVLALDSALRSFPLTVHGVGDRRLCQVHRGGIDVACIEPSTMEVIGHPGLFATGEALDVDAPCGGYNLQWAWVSGILAGTAASTHSCTVDTSKGFPS